MNVIASYYGKRGARVAGTTADVPCDYPDEAQISHRCHHSRRDRSGCGPWCESDATAPCEERTIESVWFDTTHGEWEGFICATHMANAEANHVLTYLGGLVRDASGPWSLRVEALDIGL